MATTLTKAVKRVTASPHRGKRLVVSLLPGDLIEVRQMRSRHTEIVTLGGLYDYAVKCRVSREQFEKARKKGK
jgi:hypothetical protein